MSWNTSLSPLTTYCCFFFGTGFSTAICAAGSPPNSFVKKLMSLSFGVAERDAERDDLAAARGLRRGAWCVPCWASKPVTWPIAWQFVGQLTAGRLCRGAELDRMVGQRDTPPR